MKKIVDGNEACATTAYFFSEMASIYPITPSSPMASKMDYLSNNARKNLFNDNVKVIEMQSEAGAAGSMHGALQSGVLTTTFTASQGLLLMIPNMYKMAGEMLPGVIHVAARSLATHALSIFGDHQDVYAVRQTGFCILSSSNVQDANYLSAVAHLSAIKGKLPFVHFFDGFRTSHEINTINMLEDEQLLSLVDYQAIDEFRKRAMVVGSNTTRGLAENEDIYFQSMEAKNKYYNEMPDIVNNYMEQINKITNSDYKPFNYYGDPFATDIIIAMGSVTDTIKKTIDLLLLEGKKVGMINVRLYRPFSPKYLLNVLPTSVKKIAVLDRTKEVGSNGEPLYLDVISSIQNMGIEVYGGRYGLSSKNTTPNDIYDIFNMLTNNPKNNFTVGIIDDITNTSIEHVPCEIKDSFNELLIYGFGSDGMVSASKDLLKIFGEEKDEYVQGYFQYDSKKSNGVTISNLRFSKDKINAPYYVTMPMVVVVTKDSYLNKFDCLKSIAKGGTLLLNSRKTDKELNNFLPDNIKKIIVSRNINFMVVDADTVAEKYHIKGKINTIIETILLKYLGITDYQEMIKHKLTQRFKTKGQEIIDSNVNCVNEALDNLRQYDLTFTYNETDEEKTNLFETINSLKGNDLKVSEVMPIMDGIFPGELSKTEKRNMSTEVPKWDMAKCLECGMCSFMCPHAAIRPFMISKESKYASISKDSITNKDMKYILSVSEADCTGCGLCVRNCPTKCLTMGEYDDNKQKVANDLFENHHNEIIGDRFNIKNSQFMKPKFEFSGACGGCGEAAYIKLLTQLYGENLIIANATGCSSIYGGSAPSTPYSIPWANSLFEDNAEFGYGIYLGNKKMRDRVSNIMNEVKDSVNSNIKELIENWLNNRDNYEITKSIKEKLTKENIPDNLKYLLPYVVSSNIWCIGGDGWAYDIGFGGIDHILSSNENIKILVLDTEVYSNTGGQASKSSRFGQVAEFADLGKKTSKKDMFKIAMTYPNVYVASISLGANPNQSIKAFKEAMEHNGPAIIIAYSPCLEQGIKGGLNCSVDEQKLATNSGYVLLMRYNPTDKKLYMDSKEPDFNKYEELLNNEVRYNSLKIKKPELAKELFELNKQSAKERYEYFIDLSKK